MFIVHTLEPHRIQAQKKTAFWPTKVRFGSSPRLLSLVLRLKITHISHDTTNNVDCVWIRFAVSCERKGLPIYWKKYVYSQRSPIAGIVQCVENRFLWANTCTMHCVCAHPTYAIPDIKQVPIFFIVVGAKLTVSLHLNNSIIIIIVKTIMWRRWQRQRNRKIVTGRIAKPLTTIKQQLNRIVFHRWQRDYWRRSRKFSKRA